MPESGLHRSGQAPCRFDRATFSVGGVRNLAMIIIDISEAVTLTEPEVLSATLPSHPEKALVWCMPHKPASWQQSASKGANYCVHIRAFTGGVTRHELASS